MVIPVSEKLSDLTTQLEDAATQLRSDLISSEEAAAVIDRCAQLLSELGGELDKLSWAVPSRAGHDALGQLSIEDGV